MSSWLEWMHSDEYAEIAEAEEKFFAEHWVHDLLDAPDALISVIETKIARAELGERKRIIELLENFDDTRLWRQISFHPDAYEGFDISEIIKLIKGDN